MPNFIHKDLQNMILVFRIIFDEKIEYLNKNIIKNLENCGNYQLY
jgi:hypothetical protein